MSEDETFVLAAFVAARRWVPPSEPWTRGLPAEVVTMSDCLADFEPRDAQSWPGPWLRSFAEAVNAAEGAPSGSAPVHTLSASVPESAALGLVALLGSYPYPIQDNLTQHLAPPAGEVLGGGVRGGGVLRGGLSGGEMLRGGVQGGGVRGFEVLGFDCGRFHSWLCCGLVEQARDELGIHVNDVGQLATLADARDVADLANRDRGTSAGTPLEVTWFAVRITEHIRR